jgi:DNA-directed RNA polymerase I, II, and III subunit RPABC1
MGEAETVEEKRAKLIINYRNLNVEKIEREAEKILYHLSREDQNFLLMCVVDQKTVGISYVRELKKLLDAEEAMKGIMITSGRYTYSAMRASGEMGIELIPPTLPTFDLFKHKLVPKHEILNDEERRDILERFHAKPFQFPWIKASDHVSIILGAAPGDIVKVTKESETAGRAESYRYVVK